MEKTGEAKGSAPREGLDAQLRSLREDQLDLLLICAGVVFCAMVFRALLQLTVGVPVTPSIILLPLGGSLTAWLRRRRFALASHVFILTLFAVSAFEVFLYPDSWWAIYLFVVVVVVANVVVSPASTFAVAALSTVVLAAARQAYPAQVATQEWVTATTLTWLTAMATWLAFRQLRTAVEWTRYSAEQRREALEELRDQRSELQRALKATREAYARLEKMRNALVEARAAAEEARKLKIQFANTISHEFRSPLNFIIGYSELMVRAPETYGAQPWPPGLAEDIGEIYVCSQHLSQLVDDVLDLAQVEAGRMGLVKEWTDLGDIVREAAAMTHGAVDKAGLDLHVELEADLPPVYVDRVRIRQVLLNLLNNAVRFTSQGSITLRVHRREKNLIVQVQDTGVGIPEADLSRIFEEFRQLDGSIHRSQGGSGLGLAISRQFVELHGGKIWVESQEGVGSTFSFSLPILAEPYTPESPAPQDRAYWNYLTREAHRGRRLLAVVSADLAAGAALERHLSGYEVVPVHRTAEARQLTASAPVRAVLVDEATVEARDSELASLGVPVLRCALPGTLSLAATLDIHAFLPKPIAREQLLAVLDGLSHPPERLLVVDDDPRMQRLLRHFLASRASSGKVLLASSAAQALELMREQPPDVILLDIVLPDMDGLDLLQQIRSHPAWTEIPVILISARTDVLLAQQKQPAEIHVSRGKPFAQSELIRCLQAILEGLPPQPLDWVADVPAPTETAAG